MFVVLKNKIFSLGGQLSSRAVAIALLGPWFLLLGLSLMILHQNPPSLFLLTAVWVGLFSTMRFGTIGFFAALVILGAAIVYKLPELSLWELGVAFTLALSLLVSLLSFHEAKRLLRSLEEDRTTQQQNIVHLSALLKSAQVFAVQEKKEAQKELEAIQKKWEKPDPKEQIGKIKQEIASLASSFHNFTQNPRAEFKQNSSVLHQTRKELFQLVGKFLTLQSDELSTEELALVEHVKELEGQCHTFEEGILGKLIEESRAQARTRARARKKEE